MRIAFATHVAALTARERPLDFLPPRLQGYRTRRRADFSVEITVEQRAVTDWARAYWPGPVVDPSRPSVDIRKTDFSAFFDLAERSVTARLDVPNSNFVDSLLRTSFQLFALHDRVGLVLHASSVVSEGSAVLFVGRSEAGKSTAAGLAVEAGAAFLADDITFVEVRPGKRPVAHCLPLRQKNEGPATPRSAPVAAVYSLVQAARDDVSPLPYAERLRRLMAAATLVVRHPLFAELSFELAQLLSQQVTVRRLSFVKGRAFWSTVARDLGSEARIAGT